MFFAEKKKLKKKPQIGVATTPPQKKKTLAPATQAMIGPALERFCACQSTERTCLAGKDQGRGR